MQFVLRVIILCRSLPSGEKEKKKIVKFKVDSQDDSDYKWQSGPKGSLPGTQIPNGKVEGLSHLVGFVCSHGWVF